MGRPHIEFIQPQQLPWQRYAGAGRTDVEVKVLSEDAAIGEASLLVRYPRGWSRPAPEYLTADEEIYVLDGALTIGDVTYRPHDYAYLPKGFPRPSAAAPNGAVVITFYYGVPQVKSGAPPAGYDDAARFLPRSNLDDTGWDKDYSGVDSPELVKAGARKKMLRTDPVTGDQTWLINTPAGWSETKVETHPVVQEMVLLTGEIAGPEGLMRPGAYFWRPEDIRHGPFGSRTGNIILMRSRGGRLSTQYFTPDTPFAFDPPYRPVLPPHLQALCGTEWTGTAPY